MTDVLARALPWLTVCPACDGGLPSPCICPAGDVRPVLLGLVREVERLRAMLPTDRSGCPRCGKDLPLGAYDVCAPCAAALGWDPECAACLAEQSGKPSDGPVHVGTCAPEQMP